jgi:hypothetical protein
MNREIRRSRIIESRDKIEFLLFCQQLDSTSKRPSTVIPYTVLKATTTVAVFKIAVLRYYKKASDNSKEIVCKRSILYHVTAAMSNYTSSVLGSVCSVELARLSDETL